jgi:hypothetical protein
VPLPLTALLRFDGHHQGSIAAASHGTGGTHNFYAFAGSSQTSPGLSPRSLWRRDGKD